MKAQPSKCEALHVKAASVIIPANNEARVIGRLLDALDDSDSEFRLEVIVVCNGCTDKTEDVASTHPLRPMVFSLPEGSKYAALQLGDQKATKFPRFYVDADVVLTRHDIEALATCLELQPAIMAVAPQRTMCLSQSAWAVRAYYDIWQRLPAVREGLFGRGVLGVSEDGFLRIRNRPDVLGDDLFFHLSFPAEQRQVVKGTEVLIYGPRTIRDLIRRRIRAVRGNQDLGTAGPESRTSLHQLTAVLVSEPRRWTAAFSFLCITLVARLCAQFSGNKSTWLRDESSRA